MTNRSIFLASVPTVRSRRYLPAAFLGTLLSCLLLLPSAHAAAQSKASASDTARAVNPDTARAQSLESVRVSVVRDAARSPFELPFAMASAPLSARPAQRRTGIGDLLLAVPGVQVQDRANPSQDPRIAIRGFGARSAFGVRGVRMLRDGVPLSLPDGQTPVDWIDLETVDRVDVVRGTAAAIYGNAAGGVIDLRSKSAATAPFGVDARAWDGGGLQRANVMLSGRHDDSTGLVHDPQWLGSFTRTRGDGQREWSRIDATSAFIRGIATVKGTRLEIQGTRYDAARAENTGALTAEELSINPRLPDSLNVRKHSLKSAQQTQFALMASRIGENGEIRASLFGGTRTLDNPLAFAIVGIDRSVMGGSVHGAWRSTALAWPIRLGVGADAQRQTDERYNWENCTDLKPSAPLTAKCPARTDRGAVRLNQTEREAGLGAYARAEVELPHDLYASAAVRADAVKFRVDDHFINAGNPDDSGDRMLNALSPMFGIAWRARPAFSVYSNFSTAFETPTVTELTNQESGVAGLNSLLKPQRTRTFEIGTQGIVANRVRVDAAVFRAVVLDELVPFDVPNMPGRRAFRNAGRTSRQGAEAGVRFASSMADIGMAYTWSHFRFDRYLVGGTSYAGKSIPGVPEHVFQAFATLRSRGLWSTVELSAASEASATDAGHVKSAGYAVWNLRAGYDLPSVSGGGAMRVRVTPTVGIDNIFNRHYAGSLVVNATRNRYFEPGLLRRLTLNMQLRWD